MENQKKVDPPSGLVPEANFHQENHPLPKHYFL
jgi:hypothetical protein